MSVANLILAVDMLTLLKRKLGGYSLLLLIVLACLIGLVVIILLLRSWRRYNERLRRPRPSRRQEPPIDPWHAAADRLEETELPEGTEDTDEREAPEDDGDRDDWR